MRLVVTGGAGFIGSNLVRHVLAETDDVEVVILDALTYAGHLSSLAEVAGDRRYSFVHGDIRDAEVVAATVAGADMVVNLAAESHVDRSIERPGAFLDTNVTGAGVVFEACRRAEVPRVLHVSTDEVYGPAPEGTSFGEVAPLLPSSPYSASKAGAELLARAYGITYGYPIMVTRSTNVYGPFHHPEKLVPLFVTRLIDGLDVPLYGDGRNVRDWTYVDDNVAAQWLVLTEAEPGSVHNVGAGDELSNRDLTMRLLERFGAGEDRVRHVADRPGHDLRYSVDTARVRALGWTPKVSFEDGLDRTIAFYRQREDWWRPILSRGTAAGTGVET